MEPTYEQAVADLIVAAGKAAHWLTKFCCSQNGHQIGLDLTERVHAVKDASRG